MQKVPFHIVLFGMAFLFFAMSCSENKKETPALENEDRAANAKNEKWETVKSLFEDKGINIEEPFDFFFRAFKKEKELELWIKNKTTEKYILLKKYPVCAASGTLGPKRKEGDRQVPEGFYHINRFNPKSIFHLSLGLDYPNASDLILADIEQPGSDIFIHGGCISIGCLAMQDDAIKEIYLIALQVKNEKIPVHIFPMKMRGEKWIEVKKSRPELFAFWDNIEEGFWYFETDKLLPDISVDEGGKYVYKLTW